MKTRGKNVAMVSCAALVISCIFASATTVTGQKALNCHVAKGVPRAASINQTDWHDGGEQFTPEVNVTYSLIFKAEGGGVVGDTLDQLMWLSYNDGSEAQVHFEIGNHFEDGGLDVPNTQVLNWSKLNGNDLTVQSSGRVNGTVIQSLYGFNGFAITKGTPEIVCFLNTGGSIPWRNATGVTNEVASISYQNATIKIGSVHLSTFPYMFEGKALNESVATFNVTVAATIGTGACLLTTAPYNPPWDRVPINITLIYRVTHNATNTEWKYGAIIDWSNAKNFPTHGPMNDGENFSLVAPDQLYFYLRESEITIRNFSTNAANDTAFCIVNNTEMGKMRFPTQFTELGDPTARNTTRSYNTIGPSWSIENSTVTYVCFDGFRYNQSTGMALDPAVIIPTSLPPVLNITRPEDIQYVAGQMGNSISWTVMNSSAGTTSYAIYRNGNQCDSGSWTYGVPITINIDGLAAGS
nr:hypothetical protein [Candidatus Sigynarchaeota archaeon]